jgi:hypothetical protein
MIETVEVWPLILLLASEAPRCRTDRLLSHQGVHWDVPACAIRCRMMDDRRCGRSGLKLPWISLGLWQNFGHDRTLDAKRAIIRYARSWPRLPVTRDAGRKELGQGPRTERYRDTTRALDSADGAGVDAARPTDHLRARRREQHGTAC